MIDEQELSARDWAAAQVAAACDAPEARLRLVEAMYRAHAGRGRGRLPYRRAALSFMHWQERRGILNALDAERPGSLWWREVNGRLLHDTCEAVALAEGRTGPASVPSVRLWLEFVLGPTAGRWYRAHNASIVGAYLDHRELAAQETPAERFFMNVVLLRVLYAHALVENASLALGPMAPVGRLLGDPRLGMAGVFLSLQRVLPKHYPLVAQDVRVYLTDESRFGRVLDYAVIAPRLEPLYEWSAQALAEPRLRELLHDGRPNYAWLPGEELDVWLPGRMSWPARALAFTLRARGPGRSA